MTDTHVPSVSDFSDIYPAEALDVQSKRWNNLLSTFESQYNTKADFVSRSPGRVNIIGEVREFTQPSPTQRPNFASFTICIIIIMITYA